MNDDQIAKLALKFAKNEHPYCLNDKSEFLIEDIENAKLVINFLLQKYYLVKRSKVNQKKGRGVIDFSPVYNKPIIIVTPWGDSCITNSELLFNFVRKQIKEQSVEGCYIEFNEERIPILPTGRLLKWPKGLFDKNEELLEYLL